MSNMTIITTIIDITQREDAHSEASLDDTARRSPEIIAAARPPAPSKFNRRQTRSSICEAKPLQQVARSDLGCIKAMRRQICEQIYDSELCPVTGEPEQEDLWASLDGMFMQ